MRATNALIRRFTRVRSYGLSLRCANFYHVLLDMRSGLLEIHLRIFATARNKLAQDYSPKHIGADKAVDTVVTALAGVVIVSDSSLTFILESFSFSIRTQPTPITPKISHI